MFKLFPDLMVISDLSEYIQIHFIKALDNFDKNGNEIIINSDIDGYDSLDEFNNDDEDK